MSRPNRSKTGKHRISSIIFYLCLIISLGLFVPYDYWITASPVYYNFLKAHLWGFGEEPIVPSYMKNLSVDDFKKMLTYTDEAGAAAAKAMGEKQEYGAVPELIRRLDYIRPFRWGRQNEPTSIADVSKKALSQIIIGRISSEPENISLLQPYFTAATAGSSRQRKALIEILGDIREPLAIPLLSDSARDKDPEIREAAMRAFAEINSSEMENRCYSSLRRSQRAYVLGSLILICLLVAWAINQLVSGAEKPLIMLSAAPMVLLGAMSWILANDFRQGTVTDRNLTVAIAEVNTGALRTMNYHDYTTYPGDSKVARSLVSIGNDKVIRDLLLLPTVETVDDISFTEVVDQRVQWILARIVASKLGTQGIKQLVSNNDPAVRKAVAKVLGKLTVKNESIIEALTLLSSDEDQQVRKIATEALPQVRRYPAWPGFPL